MEKPSIQFEGEALKAVELYENTTKNLFITGKAGTGKSTLLHHLRKLTKVSPIVVAPTGIAAINVKGQTIHSFFKLKPGFELDEAKNVSLKRVDVDAYRAIKTVFIDEISMVRADLIDAIDVFLRRTRDKDEPFGGVRMVFFGDLFQLPPVVGKQIEEQYFKKYKSPYFFSAKVFTPDDLFAIPFEMEKIALEKIYRQNETDFISILNGIRSNRATQKDLDFLNQRVSNDAKALNEKSRIHLVTTNQTAKNINMLRLNQLEGKAIEFNAIKRGDLENLQPNDEKITVKVGAQVMFITNDMDGRWVNGSIGTVIKHKIEKDEESNTNMDVLEVELDTGKTVETSMFTWPISQYKFKGNRFVREEIGTFTQIPLKLAWAITIHKSQGKTFHKVAIDLERGSFAHGQTYVALSRCTSLDGLILNRPVNLKDIIVDQKVVDYSS